MILQNNSITSTEYQNICSLYGFIYCTNKFTAFCNNSSSRIDNIFTENIKMCNYCISAHIVINYNITDHYAIDIFIRTVTLITIFFGKNYQTNLKHLNTLIHIENRHD